jgi:hypothetical protein
MSQCLGLAALLAITALIRETAREMWDVFGWIGSYKIFAMLCAKCGALPDSPQL